MESNFLLKNFPRGPVAEKVEDALRRNLRKDDGLLRSFSVCNGMAYFTVPEDLTKSFLSRFAFCKENKPLPGDKLCPPKKVEVEVFPLAFRQEYFDLFRRYEKVVHQSDRTEENYERFLCASPIRSCRDSRAPAITGNRYGSFTRALRVDGRLVYVGSPLYSELHKACWTFSPGKSTRSTSSTSRRCAFSHRESSPRCTNSKWQGASRSRSSTVYSLSFTLIALGLYIHDCPKMRYKEQFKPVMALKSFFSEEVFFHFNGNLFRSAGL